MADCNSCKNHGGHSGHRHIEITEPLPPSAVNVMIKNHRAEKRILIAVIVALAVMLAACSTLVYLNNQRWLDYISEYDFESYQYEYSQDGEGLNIMGSNNEVITDGTEKDNQG